MDFSTLPDRVAALLADGSPRAIATLRSIQYILDGEVVIPGGIAVLIKELDCDGCVDPGINDANLPGADAFVSSDGVRPVDIGQDWIEGEALTFLDSLGLKPSNPDRSLKWASERKDAQSNGPLAILGQKCRNSGGFVCVLVLDERVGQRSAFLCGVQDRFRRHRLVLAEPKETAPGT